MRDYDSLANCIRALSMDAVERAQSGHPGMPMGMAAAAAVLLADFLKFDPQHPDWPDRDRFVLSAGHGSMLLYSLLHLCGYPQTTLEQIKNFRQWGSGTPGHPEYGIAPGVETTTGPLGQGFANAVGMALAERMENARFGDELVNHRTYVVAGDGCLCEGISHEAASLAGHLRLSKLVVLFDDNQITIDGATSLSVSDNVLQRFESCGWNVAEADGGNPDSIKKALAEAQESSKPFFIACKTVIGFGAPNKQGTAKAHGAPLGEDEIAAARKSLNWPHPPFDIPPDLLAAWRDIGRRGEGDFQQWQKRLQNAPAELRKQWNQLRDRQHGNNSDIDSNSESESDAAIAALKKELVETPPTVATRKASEKTLNALHGKVPGLVGGSADLTGSNNTKAAGQRAICAEDYGGDYVHFGVREHAMAAAMNGMALHGLSPYGGTFLAFADYCRPAIRLSALMGARVIYVMTHDSIGLGEDGPTHQPIEHLASLRAIPNLNVYRPADAVETAECWQAALSDRRPSVIALSRQNLPPLRRQYREENLCLRGGYLLELDSADKDGRDLTIVATGSEVSVAVAAAELLLAEGLRAAVVSLACRERFEEQERAYQCEVLGDAPRFVIEAASPFGWEAYAPRSHCFSVPHFGASAPAKELFARFGFAPSEIAVSIQKLLAAK